MRPAPADFAQLTRELLCTLNQRAENPVTLAEIFRATNLKRNWLTRFAKNKIPDPSVNRVQILHDYLAKQT
jgi:hypothetical protein